MGDKALTAVAVAIRDAVRSRDIAVRYGGKEFLVLLIDVDETEALALAENVRQAVLDLKIPHLFNQEVSTTVTLSVGIALLTGANIDESLTAADQGNNCPRPLGGTSFFLAPSLEGQRCTPLPGDASPSLTPSRPKQCGQPIFSLPAHITCSLAGVGNIRLTAG